MNGHEQWNFLNLKNCLKMKFLVKINKWNNDNNNENNT